MNETWMDLKAIGLLVLTLANDTIVNYAVENSTSYFNI